MLFAVVVCTFATLETLLYRLLKLFKIQDSKTLLGVFSKNNQVILVGFKYPYTAMPFSVT